MELSGHCLLVLHHLPSRSVSVRDGLITTLCSSPILCSLSFAYGTSCWILRMYSSIATPPPLHLCTLHTWLVSGTVPWCPCWVARIGIHINNLVHDVRAYEDNTFSTTTDGYFYTSNFMWSIFPVTTPQTLYCGTNRMWKISHATKRVWTLVIFCFAKNNKSSNPFCCVWYSSLVQLFLLPVALVVLAAHFPSKIVRTVPNVTVHLSLPKTQPNAPLVVMDSNQMLSAQLVWLALLAPLPMEPWDVPSVPWAPFPIRRAPTIVLFVLRDHTRVRRNSSLMVSDQQNQTSCALCSPGTYSTEGSWVCSTCMDGFYSNISGAHNCTPCPAGFEPGTCRIIILFPGKKNTWIFTENHFSIANSFQIMYQPVKNWENMQEMNVHWKEKRRKWPKVIFFFFSFQCTFISCIHRSLRHSIHILYCMYSSNLWSYTRRWLSSLSHQHLL